MPEEKIVLMKFGSHLYGTNSEMSDQDFKGIFLPSREDAFLGNIPKSHNNAKKKAENQKNTAEDIDIESYSLQYFIKLACEGQTVAIDMLHAPDNMILETSNIWTKIVKNRDKFYTKNLKAFVSYSRKQAARYGIKGSRLNSAKKFVSFLAGHPYKDQLSTIWGLLSTGDHCYHIGMNKNGIEQYQICGKIFQSTAGIGYVCEIMKRFIEVYGKRAREAAMNKNIDFKAISHALRAAYQVRELLTTNTIVFPLKQAEFLKKIKLGELDYMTEVAPKLEALMAEVEMLSHNSTLPEKVDKKFWNGFIIAAMEGWI